MIADQSSMVYLISEMQEALTEEIQATQRSGRHIIAKDGQFLRRDGNLYIYQFTLDQFQEINEDQPLTLVHANEQISVSIVSCSGTLLIIATTQSLSAEDMQQASFQSDASFLLQAMRERLGEKRANPTFTTDFGSKVLGKSLTTDGDRASTLVAGLSFTPYPAQKRALSRSLGSEVSFVIGPPGTGKTLTLALLALEHVRQGRSVLIVSHTNIAVDNAINELAKLCTQMRFTALLQQHQIVRYGNAQIAEITENAGVYMPLIVKQKSAVLHQEREQIEQQLAALIQEYTRLHAEHEKKCQKFKQAAKNAEEQIATLRKHSLAAKQLYDQQMQIYDTALQKSADQLRLMQQRIEIRTVALNDDQQRCHTLGYEIQAEDASIASLQEQITELSTKPQIMRFFSPRARQQLREKMTIAHQQRASLLVTYNIARAKTISEKQQLDGLRHLEEQYRNEVQQVLQAKPSDEEQLRFDRSYQEWRQHLLKVQRVLNDMSSAPLPLDAEQTTLQQRIAAIDVQIREVEQEVLAQAKVVGTSLTKVAVDRFLRIRLFDIVIIDEISIAPIPLVFWAACHAKTAVTLFGDPMQLGPIFSDDDDEMQNSDPERQRKYALRKQWLGTSLFDMVKIGLEKSHLSTLLDEQARMHPQISRIVRSHVYGGKLNDSPSAQKLDAQYAPLPGQSLILCDTSQIDPIATHPKSKSRYNVYHALCDLAIAQSVLQSLPPADHEVVGIITPYTKQAKLLAQMVKGAGLERQIRVGTVHRFQGLEFDTIIFDTTDSQGTQIRDSFTGGGIGGKRLINVALTRARRKLIIVANATYIERQVKTGKLSPGSLIHHAIQEAGRLPLLDPLTLIPEMQAQNTQHQAILSSIIINQRLPIGLFDENTYFPALQKDLQAARKQVVLFAPFTKKFRLAQMVPQLREARQRGIAITLYTQDPKKEDDVSILIAELEAMQVEMHTKSNMHEKCVIIDESIVYHGSANTLSQHGLTELMTRIDSHDFAEQLYKFLLDKGEYHKRTAFQKEAEYGIDVSVQFRDIQGILRACQACREPMYVKWGPKSQTFYLGHGKKVQGCSQTDNATKEDLRTVKPFLNNPCRDHPHRMLDIHVVPQEAPVLFCAEAGCHFQRKISYHDDRKS